MSEFAIGEALFDIQSALLITEMLQQWLKQQFEVYQPTSIKIIRYRFSVQYRYVIQTFRNLLAVSRLGQR
jgi:hypothetical protein